MKNIAYAFLLLAVLNMAGCSHDLLDKQPIDRISGDVVWTSPNLVTAFVTSKYRDLGFGFNWNGDEVMWASMADESMFKHDYGVWTLNKSELTPSNLGILGSGAAEYNGNMNPWAKNYRYIKDANTFFEQTANVPNGASSGLPADLRNRLTGEMKFLRAFRYFDLIRNYGAVPLITKTFTLNTDFTQVSRNTIQEGVNFVVKEADEAAVLLPATYDEANAGRATKGAALALKARMLLYATSPTYGNVATFAQAAAAAKAVMDLNQYTLFPSYQQLFLTPRNAEIILDRTQTTGTDSYLGLERWNGPNGYGGWAGNMPTQNLVDAYETADGKAIGEAASGYNPQSPYVNRDPRFYATVLYNGTAYRGRAVETFTPGGKDSPDGPEPFNTSLTGYYLRKFMNENRALSAPVGTQSPWIYFRLGEVLLNYAEAQNEAVGPDASVYNAVNQVRARAKMPPFPAGLAQGQMRTRIRNERQVELAYEEHRYYDVRRWRVASQTENQPARGVTITRDATGKLTYNYISAQERRFADRNYYLPIPLKEIQASPKLLQNPGY